MIKSSDVLKNRRTDLILFLSILFFAFLVRIYLCPLFALGLDESYTANIASSSIEEMNSLMVGEGSPPLFYFLVKTWTSIFGDEDQSLKILALFLSSLVPPVVYLCILFITKQRRVAIAVCLLCIFSPIMIRFGNLLRPYAVLCIFNILSVTFFFSFFNGKPNKVTSFAYIIFVTFGLYSHLWSIVFLIAQAMLACFCWWRKLWSNEQFWQWIKCFAISSILFLPWFLAFIGQSEKNIAPWFYAMPWYQFVFIFPYTLMTYTVGNKSALLPFFVSVSLTVFVFYGVILLSLGSKSQKSSVYLGWISFCITVLALVFSSYSIPTRERYLLSLAVFVFTLFVSFLSRRLQFIRNDFLFAITVLCLFSVFWLNQLQVMRSIPEAAIGPLIIELKKSGSLSKDDLIAFGFNSFGPEIIRKVPTEQIAPFPFAKPKRTMDWPNQVSALKNPENFDNLTRILQKQLNEGKSVWYFGTPTDQKPSDTEDAYVQIQLITQAKIKKWLEENARVKPDSTKMRKAFDVSVEAIKFQK